MDVVTITIPGRRHVLVRAVRWHGADGFAKVATPAQQIDELANRMAAALEELMGWKKAKTHDDEVGHPFHGNQWTGGISGPKPTTMEGKSAFKGIHKLLSSGHAWSKAELMAICGLTPKKLSDYLAMLKNPKWAGSQGALEIVKNPDGTYQAQVKAAEFEAGMAAAEAAEQAAHVKIKADADAAVIALAKETKAAEKALAAKQLADALAAEKAKKEEDDKAAAKAQADQEAADFAKAVSLSSLDLKIAVKGINVAGIENPAMKADIVEAKALAAKGDLFGVKMLQDKWKNKKAPKTQKVMANLVDAMQDKADELPAAHVPAKAPEPAQAPELATPGSISKAQADKAYTEAMDEAGADLVDGIKTKPAYGEKFVLDYKDAKASAMAKWAHDVHGTAFNPKPQELFKADLQLIKDIKENGDTLAEAVAKWKHNTSLEKQGQFPPKNPTYQAAAPIKPAVHADLAGSPESVPTVPYDSLVPAGFTSINAADLTKANGFQHGISKLKSFLMYDQSNGAEAGAAQGNKKSVEHKLRERLKDKPNFQALNKRLGLAKEGSQSLEARLISAWAGSSGDSNDISVALQLAVRDAFGIPDGHVEKKQLHSLQNHGAEDKVTISGIHSLNQNAGQLKPHEVTVAHAALREFVQAQYHETQDMLAKGGFEHVYLARGMQVNVNQNSKDAAVLKLQPASSFSTNYATAKGFAGGSGTVFITKVPRQQVLSTYVTGFGCTSEHEVVVLAHEKMKAYPVKAHEAAGHVQAAEAVMNKAGIVAAKKKKAV